MPKFAILMTLGFAGLLAGCSSTGSANNGAGFETLRPSAASRSFIIANDRPFAEQIAGHNQTCETQPACRK